MDDRIYDIPADTASHMYQFIIATGYVKCTCKLAFIVFFCLFGVEACNPWHSYFNLKLLFDEKIVENFATWNAKVIWNLLTIIEIIFFFISSLYECQSFS